MPEKHEFFFNLLMYFFASTLRHLAFENTSQANIISTVSSGKIIIANSAACKLLGYSKKELLSKSRAAIFDIIESSFKKMLKERMAKGQPAALETSLHTNHCGTVDIIFTNIYLIFISGYH